MREIEFRAIAFCKNQFVYGSYIHRPLSRKNFNEHQIIDCNGIMYDIAPETLGQYTGYKDNSDNPVKIYEGDICKTTHYNHSSPSIRLVQEIVFVRGNFCVKTNNTKDEDYESFYTFLPMNYLEAPSKLIVIGNIHQNKELIDND